MNCQYLLDLALILLSTKVLGLLSHRFRMPQVVGALCAGLLLGPAVTGIIQETDFIKTTAGPGSMRDGSRDRAISSQGGYGPHPILILIPVSDILFLDITKLFGLPDEDPSDELIVGGETDPVYRILPPDRNGSLFPSAVVY